MAGWTKRKRKQGFMPVIGCHRMGEKGENDTERRDGCVLEKECEREEVGATKTGSEMKKPFQTAW